MAKSKFKITPFTNPSGEKAWRLSGTLNGERIRQNFKTRKAATELRQKYDIRQLNEEPEGRTVWTTLTLGQNEDAIAAVNILKRAKLSKSLSFAANYLVEHYREAERIGPVQQITQEYLESRSMDETRGLISRVQYNTIRAEMRTFEKVFKNRTIDTINTDDLKTYLEGKLPESRKAASLKTWNNRRGVLSTFFKFCQQHKYTADNPVIYVQQFKVKKARGTADTLSAEKATEFMHWLESYKGKQNKKGSWWGEPGCMVPYFALTLFGGIRPDYTAGEILKLRPEHIRLDTEVIFIEPEVSKTNEKRSVRIQPNLKLWLETYPIEKFPILPQRRFKDMFRHIREYWELPPDVMRHTFISMTVGAFRSVGDASLQAGNSEAVIRKHYLDLKSVEEADKFWKIVPEGETLPELEKKEGRYVATS